MEKGNCTGCHKDDATEGVDLCENCLSEAESYLGMSDEDVREWRAAEAAEEKRQRWKALRSLFDIKSHVDRPRLEYWRLYLAALVALLLNRKQDRESKKHPWYEYDQVTSWDSRAHYGSWSCMCLDVCRHSFRYRVYEDGETNL